MDCWVHGAVWVLMGFVGGVSFMALMGMMLVSATRKATSKDAGERGGAPLTPDERP